MLARRVLKNVIYNSSSVLIGNLAGLVISIYVARVLKPELFGIYSLAISVAFLLMTFTDLGINATLVRYVAHANIKGDDELVRGYIRSLTKLKALLVLAVASMLFLGSDFIAEQFFSKPELSLPLRIMALYITFFSMAGFINGIFNAFNDFKANFVRALVYEISRATLIFLLLYLGLSVAGALLGYVGASLLSLIALLAMLFRKLRNFLFGKAKRVDWRRIVRFTGYLTVGSITWTVFAYVDSVMIGAMLPSEDVGFYRAAYNIVGAVSGIVALPGVLFPVFVQLESEDLRSAFSRVFRYASIIAFPCTFGLMVIAEPLVKFVYGADYLQAAGVMVVLSILILRSALGFWGVLFNAKEMPEYPVYATFFGMILNVVLNYVFILRMGIVGAAIATVMSNAFVWFTLAFLSVKHFGVVVRASYILKPLTSAAVMTALLWYAGFGSLADAILKVLVGAGIYFLLLYVLRGFGREDVEYLRSVLAWK